MTKPYTMTSERIGQLMSDLLAVLTPEEAAEGWHFCDDWDGLLIHPSMSEYRACHCHTQYNLERRKFEEANRT